MALSFNKSRMCWLPRWVLLVLLAGSAGTLALVFTAFHSTIYQAFTHLHFLALLQKAGGEAPEVVGAALALQILMHTLGSHWRHIAVTLGLHWGHISVTLGSHWGRIGVTLGSHWGCIGVALAPHWGHIGVTLGLHWGRIGHWLALKTCRPGHACRVFSRYAPDLEQGTPFILFTTYVLELAAQLRHP
eukprot:1161539-Pelagomonas_calceolata.AAC.16